MNPLVPCRSLSEREEWLAKLMLEALPWNMAPQLDLRLSPSERRQVYSDVQHCLMNHLKSWCDQVQGYFLCNGRLDYEGCW